MQQKRESSMPWAVMLCACLLGFAMWAPSYCVPPIEHILKLELNLTHAETSLLYTGPILMLAAIGIPGGFIGDRIGARKAAGIGAIIIAVGALLRSMTSNPSALLAYTFIYGIGLGWVFPNLAKLISAWVPRDKAGVATGIYSVGIMAGVAIPMAITMPVVFPITNTFQGVFLFWSIPAIAAAASWWIIAKEPQRNKVVSGTRSVGPSFQRVIKNKHLWLVSVLFFMHNFFFFTWTGWAPHLLMLKGATDRLAGLITSIFPWVGIPTVMFMPRLAYKMGLRKPFLWVPAIVMSLAALGAIYMNLAASWLVMAMVGIASNTRLVTILALPVEMVPEEDVGTASGLIISIGHLGGVIGAWIGGRILDVTGSLDIAMLILVGISVSTVFIALGLPETGRKFDDSRLRISE